MNGSEKESKLLDLSRMPALLNVDVDPTKRLESCPCRGFS